LSYAIISHAPLARLFLFRILAIHAALRSVFLFQVKKMKKTILFLATLASAIATMTLSGCAYPDHSGVYMDQHNGREEQRHDDDRRDRRDDGYHNDYDHRYDDRRGDDNVDPRRQ
jgi:hypothetical protein